MVLECQIGQLKSNTFLVEHTSLMGIKHIQGLQFELTLPTFIIRKGDLC